MPYLKFVHKDHECYLPQARAHRGSRQPQPGSVWMCPSCGKQWILKFVPEAWPEPDGKHVPHEGWEELPKKKYLPVKGGSR